MNKLLQNSHIPSDQAKLWKPEQFQEISLLKAHFSNFVYQKHAHGGFAIGIIEQGVQKFHHRGRHHFAPSTAMITVNPDEVHDGAAAVDEGYQYRMAYIPRNVIEEILIDLSGPQCLSGYFKEPVTHDPEIAQQLHQALIMLDNDQNSNRILEARTRFAQVIADLFQRHSAHHHSSSCNLKDKSVVTRACEYIRSRVSENISLDEIAASVGLSRYHFLRIFKNTTGLPPHAYLIRQRVELAKEAIEKGASLADAAMQAGFSDQSHLTRRFKAVYGLPPGQYKQALSLP